MALSRDVVRAPGKPAKAPGPLFSGERAREMQKRSVEARKRNARERAIATRADLQDALLPHVEKMVLDAVKYGDQQAFLRWFEHGFGRAPESVEVHHEGDVRIVIQNPFADVVDVDAVEEV